MVPLRIVSTGRAGANNIPCRTASSRAGGIASGTSRRDGSSTGAEGQATWFELGCGLAVGVSSPGPQQERLCARVVNALLQPSLRTRAAHRIHWARHRRGCTLDASPAHLEARAEDVHVEFVLKHQIVNEVLNFFELVVLFPVHALDPPFEPRPE
eukprot:scaffold4219_cov618-Prasinococcus_capsulatus_cf.AAC.2